MVPETVTRVLIQFRQAAVPYIVPESHRTGGHEFVWHCPIPEHEEHDMLCPLIVKENVTYAPFVFNQKYIREIGSTIPPISTVLRQNPL